jgi:HSP20 family protein
MRLISYKPQLTPWSPFDRMASLRDLLDSAFELASSGADLNGQRGWMPPLDIREDEEKVTVTLEAAGLKKEDFDISLHDDNLTISGERKSESEKREGESFRSERIFGRFSRTVTLPSQVRADGVTAAYTDGVLAITLPKAEEAKPRKIEVNVE